ncbi:MAPEG family protein [Rhodobacteraceae bacterium NNCM2]|nr:MAPEG family protein [Coraliihabitans acroporae]
MTDQAAEARAVTGRIGIAAIGMLVWFAAAFALLPGAGIGGGAADRLAYAAFWLLLPAISLVLAVGLIARHRHLVNAIDGGWDPADRMLEIYRRNLANTVEQVLIASLAYPAFAINAPEGWLILIPAGCALFLLARLAFLWGLTKGGARDRAIGFACTFYPSVLLLLAGLYLGLVG